MWILKLILAIIVAPVAYMIFYHSLAAFVPSSLAAIVAIIASITLAALIIGAGR